jgi:chromosome partitioning protein
MKTLLYANQKGGTGKSACATQHAYHVGDVLKRRVVVIDLDHQGNTSRPLVESGYAAVADVGASELLTNAKLKVSDFPDHPFVIVPADRAALLELERKEAMRNDYAARFKDNLALLSDRFDLCIIDTNPNPDVRVLAALYASEYVVSPIQLNQEALDGIASLIEDVEGMQEFNPALTLIGILPNLVQATPFQKENLQQIVSEHRELLISKLDGHPALIPTRTAVAEAQAASKPIYKMGNTSSRDAWKEIRPVFEAINHHMGLI